MANSTTTSTGHSLSRSIITSTTTTIVWENTSSLSSTFPTLPGPAYPTPQVPPTDAPYLQKSRYPHNYVFMVVGIMLLVSFLFLCSWILAVQWYIHRQHRIYTEKLMPKRKVGSSGNSTIDNQYFRVPTLPQIEMDDLDHQPQTNTGTPGSLEHNNALLVKAGSDPRPPSTGASTQSSRLSGTRTLEEANAILLAVGLEPRRLSTVPSTGTSTQSARPSVISLNSQYTSRNQTPDRRSAASVDSALHSVSDRLSTIAPDRQPYVKRPRPPPPDAFRRSSMNSTLYYSASTQARRSRGTGLGTDWRGEERRVSGQGYAMRAMRAIAEDEVVGRNWSIREDLNNQDISAVRPGLGVNF